MASNHKTCQPKKCLLGMYQPKFVQFLTALSADEFKALGRFLDSAHFNTDPNLQAFYAALAERAPIFAAEKMDKQQLFAEVFPDAKWNDGKWRNLVSKFVKALESYFVQLELDELTRRRVLAQAFSKRNLFQHFEKEQRALIAELEAQPVLDLENLRKAMLLKWELSQHPLSLSTDKYQEIVDLLRNLELFYQIKKTRLNCDLLNLERIQGKRCLPRPHLPPNRRCSDCTGLFSAFFPVTRKRIFKGPKSSSCKTWTI